MNSTPLKRFIRNVGLLVFYCVISVAALFWSYRFRFDGAIPDEFRLQMIKLLPWVVGAQILGLAAVGQTRILLGYFSVVDLKALFLSVCISGLGLRLGFKYYGVHVPRGVQLLDVLLFFGGVSTLRLLLRRWLEFFRDRGSIQKAEGNIEPSKIAIVGAGNVGAMLVREILTKPSLRLKPIVFFDDDRSKWGKSLHGIPIVGSPEDLLNDPWRNSIKRVIIAMPNASVTRVQDVARLALKIGVTSDTVPAFDQLVSGKVQFSQVRPVQIEDLLKRPVVSLNADSIKCIISDKVVAVTGAGGSIGGELCRQILGYSPKTILLIDKSEVLLFQIEQQIIGLNLQNNIIPLIADICDEERIRQILGEYRPSVIFHAAAFKHVPLMERQPAEAILNNTFGSLGLMKLACEFGVSRFVMISTDKAVNPTNIMGASKRLAELFLQAFFASDKMETKFMAVRFGNVLGSSGSVVPIFQKQIAKGGPVTVTHPEVTRYFMTIPEAVGLVLQAATIGQGGEVFVLDMGEPIKIVDLAKQMIELSGYEVGKDITIAFTGLRPGEKMFEELSHEKEKLVETEHSKIFRFVSTPIKIQEFEKDLGELKLIALRRDSLAVRRIVKKLMPEYNPQ
jgi:FlaA1/EpsC-like NDP-sugar epimerase